MAIEFRAQIMREKQRGLSVSTLFSTCIDMDIVRLRNWVTELLINLQKANSFLCMRSYMRRRMRKKTTTQNLCFGPGTTQTRLYSHSLIFRILEEDDGLCTIRVAKTKAPIS